MNEKDLVKISKTLSFVLRHKPESIGLVLDEKGYVLVASLLQQLKVRGTNVTLEVLKQVVESDNKKRYAFSDDGLRIRASQGHSVAVDLGYKPKEPPETLFHGTATRFVESIKRQGLLRDTRTHVHLSFDEATAVTVGARHGQPVVLQVDAGAMARAGLHFFISDNGVWLTEHVPAKYLRYPNV